MGRLPKIIRCEMKVRSECESLVIGPAGPLAFFLIIAGAFTSYYVFNPYIYYTMNPYMDMNYIMVCSW